jgi:EAL domain-containing protein (putative c-di-GMP-specific phosphodiesterase class I)
VLVNGKQFQLSATIGISLWPDDDKSGEHLVKHAEMAMYHAKEGGRCNFEYFSVGRQQQELTRLNLEHELSLALDRNQFTLYYQPQIDAKTNKVVGVEALIRWIHPKQGFISPDTFIPIAEANGQIVPISDWVLETAIKTALSWQSELDEPIKMAVNISGIHFNESSFAYSIIVLLERYQFAPQNLCLEITEGTLISDIEKPLAALQKLRSMGVQVAIDDFGTGYSSLAYLKQFPVTSLKIDKSFVLNLSSDKDDQAIVNSVVSLGHFLGFEVLAEGVEHLEDYRLLQEIGCDQVQGYYFAKPLSADEALEFIQGFSFKS